MKFEILEKLKIPTTDYSVVYAICKGEYCKYVTWLEIDGRYHYGHYFVEQDEAWRDFLERCIKELKVLLR